MPLSIPAELKKITPFIRRAEELDRDKANAESRLVAYYCRQYAVHSGIALANSDEGKNCLGEILNALEGEKAAMDSFTRDEAKFLCETFANKIFDKADDEDRAGNASRNTAKTFYAAASFLEILQQFFQDDDDSEEVEEIKKRSVYAKWKATDILKAIKEGRPPAPGGYGEEETEEEEEEEETTGGPEDSELPVVETAEEEEEEEPIIRMPDPSPQNQEVEEEEEEEEEAEELGPPPAYVESSIPPPPPATAPQEPPRPPLTFNPPAPMPPPPTRKPEPAPAPASTPKKSGLFGFGGKNKKTKLSKAELADAKELTRFALAALEDKNADLAADRLQQALQVLGR